MIRDCLNVAAVVLLRLELSVIGAGLRLDWLAVAGVAGLVMELG